MGRFFLVALCLVATLMLPQTVNCSYPLEEDAAAVHLLGPSLATLWESQFSGFASSIAADYAAAMTVPPKENCTHGGQPETNGNCTCADSNNFNGLRCEMCQRDGSCHDSSGDSSECNQSLSVRGANKQFECALDSPFFINLMGGGRKIEAIVTLNCTTEDGGAFASGNSGVCAMTLYRIEPNHTFVDPFFRCITSKCSMRLATEEINKDDNSTKTSKRVFKALTLTGQVVLVTLCSLLALLRCVSSKLGRRLMARILVGLGITLVVFTLLFIGVMFGNMRPRHPAMLAVYECKETECSCAEYPPSGNKPICANTILNDKILPMIRNSIRFACNLQTKLCQLTLADLALMFDLQCNASECVNTRQFPNGPSMEESIIARAQRNLLVIVALVFVLSIMAIMTHAFWLSSKSKRKALEFIRIFSLSETLPLSGSLGQMLEEETVEERFFDKGSVGDVVDSVRQPNRQVQTEDNTKEVVPDANEFVGLVSHSRTRHVHATSDARRTFTTTPYEADQVEFTRKLTRSSFELKVTDLEYALIGSRFAIHEEARTRLILHQVNFTVRSGEVLAILGPSGAGKTTLLDLLSARSKQGQTTGSITFNGTAVSTNSASVIEQYRNIIGYVSQEDTFLPALTVYQTIEYAARLKLPQAFSNATIKNIVRHMIEALKLQRCEHTVIGDGSGLRGVSGGEKRRVSIAVELLANPRILFLDEPTSGLDAVSAKRVMDAVVELAKESPMRAYAPHYFAFKPIVIFSIHQPSQEIFELFDKLLLLSRGVNVYSGPARCAAATLEARVLRVIGGVRAVPRSADHPNHAEYLMKLEEVLDDPARMELRAEDTLQAATQYEGTEFFRHSQQEALSGSEAVASATGGGGEEEEEEGERLVLGADILRTVIGFRVYYANVYQQLALLTSRAASCLISSFHLIVCHAAVTSCVGVLMMVLYREQNLDLPGALNRAGSITFLLLVVSFVSLSCLEQLVAERKLFVVERENGFYHTLPYLLSKVVVDIVPLRIVPALVLASLIYFPMGLRVDDGMHFFWFVVVVVLFSVCITLVVLCIGIVTRSFGAAALLSSVVILWNFVFGGFLVQAETVPSALRLFQAISPFFLAFEALLVNELDGQACTFSPTDETGKPAATSIPIMCVQYLSNIGLRPARFNNDVALLAVFTAGLFALAFWLLAKFNTIVR
ncbi:ABC transporter [Trypanosoma grayi]|uniref:ABC transporter n=1 Tax=Trypanosoma grayi TaxID=71804 RepID=UPI0004F4063F|nr:ABC transporter [Trypanosoma grayi]KEG12839.1 ABC transporter [Trypanosoma grayi]